MNEMPLWIAIKIISHAFCEAKHEKKEGRRGKYFEKISSFENYPRAGLIQ